MKTTIILLLVLMSTQAMARRNYRTRYRRVSQQQSQQELKQTQKKKAQEAREFEVALAYLQTENGKGEDMVESQMLEASIARQFFASSLVSTTTGFHLGAGELDKKDMELETGRARLYELGVSQKLSLNIRSGNNTLSPYIKAGISRGTYNIKDDYTDEYGHFNAEAEIDYTRYAGIVGLSLETAVGLTPFLEYRRSRFQFDKKGKSKIVYQGKTYNEDLTYQGKDRRTYDNSLVLGLGYRF